MKEIRDIKIDLLMGNQNPIVDLFNDITKDLQIINCDVYNKDGLEFIYHKDGQWIFYQDCKNEKFWTHYYRYWALFESKFSFKYQEIQAITKYLVEEALKREVGTPNLLLHLKFNWVEEALKREVGTPDREIIIKEVVVEEALKREVGTPLRRSLGISILVEEALKREVGTPRIRSKFCTEKVEEALKREVGTPLNSCIDEYNKVEEALKREVGTPGFNIQS